MAMSSSYSNSTLSIIHSSRLFVITTKQALHGCTWNGTDKIHMILHCALWAANARCYWLTNSR